MGHQIQFMSSRDKLLIYKSLEKADKNLVNTEQGTCITTLIGNVIEVHSAHKNACVGKEKITVRNFHTQK